MAGEAALDCRIAAEKLKELFGIRTLLICGGGLINGTFLQQGMLDELSLLLSPAVDGEVGSPSVFECSAGLWASAPKEFQLAEVQRLGESGLRLVYRRW